MEKLSINTPQNVNIDYPLASVGSRILAIGIDYLLMIAYSIVMFYMLSKFFARMINTDSYFIYGIVTFLLLPVMTYHLWMEAFFHGQTLGMKIVKLKVMKTDGSRAGIYEYFIRWSMNIVDVWLMSGIIGLVAIISTKKSQRIGDLAAGTTVINLKPRLALMQTIYASLAESYQVVYPQVIAFSDKDINEIKRIFDTAIARNDIQILTKLATRLKKVMKIETIKSSEEKFIQTVINDHYHTFRK